MNSNVLHFDAEVTAAYKGNSPCADKTEGMPDEFKYDARTREAQAAIRVEKHTPIRLTRTANVLSAPVGSPCRLRVDMTTGMGELYGVAEEIIFADCEGTEQPGGPVIIENPVEPIPRDPPPVGLE